MRAALCLGMLAVQFVTSPATGTDRAADLEKIVAAERAFAARAQVVNARKAFAEYFGPDAIMFSPFPAPAFPRLRETPDWSVNIQWRPVAAAVSGAGDMGYTTGPSEFRRTPAERADRIRTLHVGVAAAARRPVPGQHRYRDRSSAAAGTNSGLDAACHAATGGTRAKH